MAGGLYGFPADYALWWLAFASLLVHTWCFFRFYPGKKRPRMKLVVGNGMVTLCLLGAVALSAETYLRFLSVGTDSFGMTSASDRWFTLHVDLNSQRVRDAEWVVQKPADVRRIAFVGDSFTYGWGVERVEDRFTNRIAARFDDAPAGKIEVMNVAMPGWDTGDQIPAINDMIDRYGVDEIVLCYVANDIERLIPIQGGIDPTEPPKPRWFNVTGSALVEYLFYRVYAPHSPTVSGYHDWLADAYDDRDLMRRQQDRLGVIIKKCRDEGVTLRVALMPYIRIGGTRLKPTNLHKRLATFFETNGVQVVDLLPVLVGQDAAELVVNAHDAHPNARAHELFADTIWRAFYAGDSP